MITAIILLAIIIAIAAYLTYSLDKKDESPTVPTYTKEELDNIKLAEELYNKDLRPIVAKKAKPVVAQELEVVEPEFVEKIVEIAKVFPEDAVINLEEVKPVKKKRKYYPKKKK
jgi:hypothetical protein